MKTIEKRIQKQEKRQFGKLIRKYTDRFAASRSEHDCSRLRDLHAVYKIKFGEEYKGE